MSISLFRFGCVTKEEGHGGGFYLNTFYLSFSLKFSQPEVR